MTGLVWKEEAPSLNSWHTQGDITGPCGRKRPSNSGGAEERMGRESVRGWLVTLEMGTWWLVIIIIVVVIVVIIILCVDLALQHVLQPVL